MIKPFGDVALTVCSREQHCRAKEGAVTPCRVWLRRAAAPFGQLRTNGKDFAVTHDEAERAESIIIGGSEFDDDLVTDEILGWTPLSHYFPHEFAPHLRISNRNIPGAAPSAVRLLLLVPLHDAHPGLRIRSASRSGVVVVRARRWPSPVSR